MIIKLPFVTAKHGKGMPATLQKSLFTPQAKFIEAIESKRFFLLRNNCLETSAEGSG